MKIYSTETVQTELNQNDTFYINFQLLLLELREVINKVKRHHDSILIDFIKTEGGTLTKIHDGGTNYQDEAGGPESIIYYQNKSIAVVDKNYRLHYDIGKKLFGFIEENKSNHSKTNFSL